MTTFETGIEEVLLEVTDGVWDSRPLIFPTAALACWYWV